jgi:hypothetical protein
MKKILIAASVSLCFATTTFAEEKEKVGSILAFDSTLGGVTVPEVVAGVSALAVLVGINFNSKGTITPIIVVPSPEPTCNGSDPLVDGVCTGTTTTVTVTGTGTTTGTVTVPVTFTYNPVVVVPDPEPTCNGSDPLVDGVCTGTTTTVTVTGTGTTTGTVTVPATFTDTPVVVVPGPEPTCNGSDPLVDGVCTGTTTTVTVTGTTTGTVTVPATFTYVSTL